MRIISVGKKYDSRIYVLDKDKIIFKLVCTCPAFVGNDNFPGNRIKNYGSFADKKYYAVACKHLRPFIEALEKQGYILKKPKEMQGENKLSRKLRNQLLERAGGSCEHLVMKDGIFDKCESTDRLQIHRKIRKGNGGKYNMENCIVLCWDCHMGPTSVHANEFRGCQGK